MSGEPQILVGSAAPTDPSTSPASTAAARPGSTGGPARRWRVALVVFLALALGACDWPLVGYDPARTNFNPFEQRVNLVNVGSLRPMWSAPNIQHNPQPIVAQGIVYVSSDEFQSPNPLAVQAFDARGIEGCSGTPKTCAPLWSIPGTATALGVAGGVLYAATGGRLAAFDAAGREGCSGSPKSCAPLWTADGIRARSFVAAGGFVYGTSSDGSLLHAFDAAGIDGCSGTPKVCTPVWSAEGGGVPAVANGIVYTTQPEGSYEPLRAFDANGVQNCSGTPKVCAPLWTARNTVAEFAVAPVVAHGLVFLGAGSLIVTDDNFYGGLVAFDAAGVRGCSGTPKTCEAIWRAPTDGILNPPAVAGDRIYVTDEFVNIFPPVVRNTLRAFDIDACMTSRPACSPLWTASDVSLRSPAVANGVVYATHVHGNRIAAFDAAGNVNCVGVPKACAPVASWLSTIDLGSPVIVDGVMYHVEFGELRAYGLP
jgi:outer membrane protein assembly factor BamB